MCDAWKSTVVSWEGFIHAFLNYLYRLLLLLWVSFSDSTGMLQLVFVCFVFVLLVIRGALTLSNRAGF